MKKTDLVGKILSLIFCVCTALYINFLTSYFDHTIKIGLTIFLIVMGFMSFIKILEHADQNINKDK